MISDILICECGNPAHQVIFRYDDSDDAKFVFMSVHLTPHKSFFKRLITGLKYIFFSTISDYGDFEEVILYQEHASTLHKIADYLKENK